MRVIHHHQERLSLIDPLESPRHRFQVSDSRLNSFRRIAQPDSRADRRQNIVDVDSPHQRRLHLHRAFRGLRGEVQPVKCQLEFLGFQVRTILQTVR